MAKQMALSREMEELPAGEQLAFYQNRMWPLIEELSAIDSQKEPLMLKVQQLEEQINAANSAATRK